MMDTLIQDLRFALRQLRRSPAATLAATVTLALGVGAATSIVSVVDVLMLRELPYPEADRIVTVWQNDRGEGNPRADVAPGSFLAWRERSGSFEELAAVEPFSLALTGDGRPEDLRTNLVTEGFFETLRVRPLLGRTFRPEEHRAGADRVVLLSHALWRGRFGGDRGIVGRTLTLDGNPYEVIGVLPPELELGLPQANEGGLWSPKVISDRERLIHGDGWWNVVGRLAPGVGLAEARADLERIAASLATEHPSSNAGIGATAVSLRQTLVGAARPALLVLLAAVGLVLLVACANVANLLLARGAERERELAVRRALGAGRRRLLAQLLTEAAVLALLGGTAGALLAGWGVEAIRGLSPGDIPRLEMVSVDLRVLGFALALTGLTAVAFGLVPALRLSSPGGRDSLREGGSSPGVRHRRLHGGLVVAQMALALTLLVGSGLLLRSFVGLLRTDPGFEPEGVLALQVFAWDGRPTDEERVLFFDRTLERIRGLPDVVAAGALSAAPFLEADMANRTSLRVRGRAEPAPGEEPVAYVSHATPGALTAASVPLVAGRPFTDLDRAGTPAVALVNETLARRVWPGEDPIGDRILLGDEEPFEAEIVGVVGAIRHTGLDVEPRPEVFLPQAQTGYASMTYLVRVRGRPGPLMEAVQREIWEVDPNQTFYQTATLEGLVRESVAGRRFSLLLLTTFAAIALVMAAVGLYGVVRFSVSRRMRELGIRLALGADRRRLVRLVVAEAMRPALLGAGLGVAASLAASGLLRSLLYGVAPRDGLTLLAASALLLATALAAAWLPARRAARLDPARVLREE